MSKTSSIIFFAKNVAIYTLSSGKLKTWESCSCKTFEKFHASESQNLEFTPDSVCHTFGKFLFWNWWLFLWVSGLEDFDADSVYEGKGAMLEKVYFSFWQKGKGVGIFFQNFNILRFIQFAEKKRQCLFAEENKKY